MGGGEAFRGAHSELTEQIIGVFFTVANELGFGFVESVYRRAMVVALRQSGLAAEEEVAVPVWFRGVKVGTYFADIVVEDLIVLELKTSDVISEAFKAQALHYLRASTFEVGFVLAFGQKALYQRVAMSNDRKLKQQRDSNQASIRSHLS